jgi:hypothetical protein
MTNRGRSRQRAFGIDRASSCMVFPSPNSVDGMQDRGGSGRCEAMSVAMKSRLSLRARPLVSVSFDSKGARFRS